MLKTNSWTYNFVEVYGHNTILSVLRLEVSVYKVYVTNQFQTKVNPLIEVTVNSQEESS